MYDIIGKRYWYFLLSLIIIVPGVIALATVGLKPSIDFTGGSAMELRFGEAVLPSEVRAVFVDAGYSDTSVQNVGDDHTVQVRMKQIDEVQKAQIEASLVEKYGPVDELLFRSVGPAVGAEVTRSAYQAVIVASLAIMLFIIVAFRKVPNAFRYGICAIIAMLHDILVATGMFAILGYFFGWEVDALFLTALLTVVGFSVQDTIVVFDRIRENIMRRRGEPYEVIVNRSLLETLHRSLVTQLNAVFVMVAILLFGGATIQQFIVVLLIGMISGSYSSIFNAVPLLVVWNNGEIGKFFRRLGRKPAAA
jgi:preprotein translocase subunit SecF